MRIHFVFLCILLTAGCASSVGNKKSILLYNAPIEKMSMTEVTKLYGKPSASWSLGDGNTAHQYQYAIQRHSPLAYLPIIYYFTSLSGANYETVLTANNDDVIEVKKFYSDFRSSHEGNCSSNLSVTQCIKFESPMEQP